MVVTRASAANAVEAGASAKKATSVQRALSNALAKKVAVAKKLAQKTTQKAAQKRKAELSSQLAQKPAQKRKAELSSQLENPEGFPQAPAQKVAQKVAQKAKSSSGPSSRSSRRKKSTKVSRGRRWTDKKLLGRFTKPGEPGAYTNSTKLALALNIDRDRAERALSKSRALQVHRKTVNRFPRRRTLALPFHFNSIDLKDLSSLSEYNEGYRYLLFSLDLGSRFLYVKPLKSKTAREVTDAVREIFTEMKKAGRRLPRSIFLDQGREFNNTVFRKFLKSKNVHLYTTRDSLIKASNVERVIATLTQMLYRYFTRENTYEYLRVLPAMVKSYNDTHHSSLGKAPSAVTVWDSHDLWLRQHWHNKQAHIVKKPKFAVGDIVFLVKDKKTFEKAATRRFTGELFRVIKVIRTNPVTYVIADMADNTVAGSFYAQEMIPTTLPEYFEVEEVIRSRKPKGQPVEYFIKYLNYPSSFNAWVKESDIKQYKTEEDLDSKSK